MKKILALACITLTNIHIFAAWGPKEMQRQTRLEKRADLQGQVDALKIQLDTEQNDLKRRSLQDKINDLQSQINFIDMRPARLAR